MNGRIRPAAVLTSSTPTAAVVFEEVTRISINCQKTKWIGVARSAIPESRARYYRVGGWGYVEMGYPRPGSHSFSDVYSYCAARAGSHRGARFSGSECPELRHGSGPGLRPRSDLCRQDRALRRRSIPVSGQ